MAYDNVRAVVSYRCDLKTIVEIKEAFYCTCLPCRSVSHEEMVKVESLACLVNVYTIELCVLDDTVSGNVVVDLHRTTTGGTK